jgi:hypothetical protein
MEEEESFYEEESLFMDELSKEVHQSDANLFVETFAEIEQLTEHTMSFEEKMELINDIISDEYYQELRSMSFDEIKNIRDYNLKMFQVIRNFNKGNMKAPPAPTTAELKQREFLRCKYDLVYFVSNYVKATTAAGLMDYVLTDFMEMVMRFAEASITLNLISSRQLGKTFLMVAISVWQFIFWNNSRSLYVNIEVADNKKNLRTFSEIINCLPEFLNTFKDTDPNKIDNVYEKISSNGSALTGIVVNKESPKMSGRGKSSSGVYFDECGFIPRIADAMSPILFTKSTYGKLARERGVPTPHLNLSTPNDLTSESGVFFYNLVQKSERLDLDEYLELYRDLTPQELRDLFTQKYGISSVTIQVDWFYGPGRCRNKALFKRPNFKSEIIPILMNINTTIEEIRKIDVGLAEYMMEARSLSNNFKELKRDVFNMFLASTESSIFEEEVVENMQHSVREPKYSIPLNSILRGKLNIYDEINVNPIGRIQYLLSIDPSRSATMSADYCAFSITEIETGKLVAEAKLKVGRVKNIYPIIKEIDTVIMKGNVIISVERNSFGISVVEDLEDDPHIKGRLFHTYQKSKYGDINRENKVYGIDTNASTRPLMIEALLSYLVDNQNNIKSKNLYDEVITLEERNGKVASFTGHDDLCMSIAQALYIITFHKEVLRKITMSAMQLRREINKISILNDRSLSGSEAISRMRSESGPSSSNLEKHYEKQFEQVRNDVGRNLGDLFSSLNRM